MNENSKALYHELVINKIIPEIKKYHDNNLTKEEIDLIGSHLDKEIEDLNQHIDNEKKIETKPNNDNLVKNETIKHLYNQLDIYKEQSKRDKDIE